MIVLKRLANCVRQALEGLRTFLFCPGRGRDCCLLLFTPRARCPAPRLAILSAFVRDKCSERGLGFDEERTRCAACRDCGLCHGTQGGVHNRKNYPGGALTKEMMTDAHADDGRNDDGRTRKTK